MSSYTILDFSLSRPLNPDNYGTLTHFKVYGETVTDYDRLNNLENSPKIRAGIPLDEDLYHGLLITYILKFENIYEIKYQMMLAYDVSFTKTYLIMNFWKNGENIYQTETSPLSTRNRVKVNDGDQEFYGLSSNLLRTGVDIYSGQGIMSTKECSLSIDNSVLGVKKLDVSRRIRCFSDALSSSSCYFNKEAEMNDVYGSNGNKYLYWSSSGSQSEWGGVYGGLSCDTENGSNLYRVSGQTQDDDDQIEMESFYCYYDPDTYTWEFNQPEFKCSAASSSGASGAGGNECIPCTEKQIKNFDCDHGRCCRTGKKLQKKVCECDLGWNKPTEEEGDDRFCTVDIDECSLETDHPWKDICPEHSTCRNLDIRVNQNITGYTCDCDPEFHHFEGFLDFNHEISQNGYIRDGLLVWGVWISQIDYYGIVNI